MSLSQQSNFDIAIIGGGFSALAVLANLSRANTSAKICVIADTGFESFGPAYSTIHQEHLLNVRASHMGLYADDAGGFAKWAGCGADDYMPRMTYAKYLRHILSTLPPVTIIKSTAHDIDRVDGALVITTDTEKIAAQACVIAAGNKILIDGTQKNLVENAWLFDYATLKNSTADVAIIGTGLTALDTVLSLENCGFKGKISCFSGNSHLPLVHPARYDATQVPKIDAARFKGLSLPKLLQSLRELAASVDWQYAVDSLRPHTVSIWQTMTTKDQLRVIKKYLWLWNMHRHRFAPHLAAMIDRLKSEGRLTLNKGRVNKAIDSANGITLDVRGHGSLEFLLAFKCVGPSYKITDQPLMQKLIAKNMVSAHANGYGLSVAADYSAAENVFVLGPPLFGHYLETVAVPDLRHQAAAVAQSVLKTIA